MKRPLLALVPLLLVLSGAAFAFVTRAGDDPPTVDAAPEATPAPTPPPILVDVAGAVARPGVVRLPAGARVMDALLAAGGMTGEADLFALNKAAPLRDGMRIYVPRPGEQPPAGSVGSQAETKLNLNVAAASELDGLPGVGPTTAAAIVRSRAEKPFSRVEELQTRGLVSPRVFGGIRDLVTVK